MKRGENLAFVVCDVRCEGANLAEAEHRARARGMWWARRGFERDRSAAAGGGGGLRVGRVYADGLDGGQGADGALGLAAVADAVGTIHAEEVVAAGNESVRHLGLAAHQTLGGAEERVRRAGAVGRGGP
jgi:hypothetical protein